jgi:hypothetical protein
LWLANSYRCKVSAGITIVVIGVLIAFSTGCPAAQLQTAASFTPKDNFGIPAYHGSISFGVDGSYSTATFDNDSWTFTNLLLDGSSPIANLEFSAQNSNVTILSYLTTNNTSISTERLKYIASGRGEQIVNLGIGPEESGLSASVQWGVILTKNNKSTFFSEGNGWTVSNDGTVDVIGETGNITVMHYDFSQSLGNSSKLPLYLQHSVAILTGVGIAVTVVIAVAIKVKTREPSAKMKQEKMQK